MKVVVATLLTLVAGTSMASADSSGTMTVSGSTVATIRWAATDALSQLRSAIGPSGPGTLAGDLVVLEEEPGDADGRRCYVIGGEVVVSSNVAYDLLLTGASSTSGLRFLNGEALGFAACLDGEPVSNTMFASSGPAGGWMIRQPRTAERAHGYALGLIVDSGEDPVSALDGARFDVRALASR